MKFALIIFITNKAIHAMVISLFFLLVNKNDISNKVKN